MDVNGIEITPKSDSLVIIKKDWKEYLEDWTLFWWFDVFWNVVSCNCRVEYKIFKWTGLVYNENFFVCDNIFHKNNGNKEENLYFFVYKKNDKIFYCYENEKAKFQKFLRSWDLNDLETEIKFISKYFSEKKPLIWDYKMFI